MNSSLANVYLPWAIFLYLKLVGSKWEKDTERLYREKEEKRKGKRRERDYGTNIRDCETVCAGSEHS
jgi:hypothetical protein